MTSISLNGAWNFHLDPLAHNTPIKPQDDWPTMNIPTNWEKAGVHNYSGVVWFSRTFHLDDLRGFKQIYLAFQGVDYFCDVWLNDQKIGHHEGYFQPFEFLITPFIKPGPNLLMVRVDAPFEPPGPDGWPSKKRLIKGVLSHWDGRPGGGDPDRGQDMGSGGIWNDVSLEFRGDCHVSLAKVSTILGKGEAQILCDTEITHLGEAKEEVIRLKVWPRNFVDSTQEFEVKKKIRPPPGLNRTHLVHTLKKPKLWDTWDHGTPHLYDMSIQIAGTTKRSHFGIREIKANKDWQFHLNGKRLFIRGSNVIPTLWLSEYDQKAIDQDIALIKEAGLNGVRVCVHVNREEFYTACDEAGLVIWNDFALQWSYDDDDSFRENACSQIQDFIRLLHHHPSIIAWACQNEPLANHDTLTPLLELVVKEEDGTRPICKAATFSQHTYKGWYAASKEEYLAIPASPFCNEYGAQALPHLETMTEMFSDEELWPTKEEHWQKWQYHNFQHDETFNVAMIQQGDSIEEFIENSQKYQFDLIKTATEAYRSVKYTRMNSFFHFMFMDAWPSITWSVVDYFRRKKRGYEALKLSCQPILVMVNKVHRYRQRLEIGKRANILVLASIAVVNDLRQSLEGCRIVVKVEHQKTGVVTEIGSLRVDIEPDSVMSLPNVLTVLEQRPEDRHAGFDEFLSQLSTRTANLEPGFYVYRLFLLDDAGEKLSENYETIEFVKPVMPPGAPILG